MFRRAASAPDIITTVLAPSDCWLALPAVTGFTFLSTVVTAANLPLYLGCSLALGVLWWRGQRDAGRDLLVAAVLGVGYAIFAFVGMGAQPFWLALALMVAGLPLYFFLRHLRNRTTRHA